MAISGDDERSSLKSLKTEVSPHVHTITNDGLTSQRETSVTFGQQSSLRKLPIPALEETLTKFPSVVEALQTEAQQKETQRECQAFLEGPGPDLQKALEEYAQDGVESGKHGSYMEEFWNESYLAPDASVVLNLNPFFVLEASPDPKLANQLGRASSLCFAAVKFASMLKHEQLPPDKHRGQSLCMDQFKVLFGASRQPSLGQCDQVSVYNDSSHGKCKIHLLPSGQRLTHAFPQLLFFAETSFITFKLFGQKRDM